MFFVSGLDKYTKNNPTAKDNKNTGNEINLFKLIIYKIYILN